VKQVPTVIGLLLCEQVVIEKHTENISLINCFTKRTIGDFPSEPQRFAVVALLTDGFGEIALDLVIEHLDNEDEVYRESQRLRFIDRVQEVRFLYRVTRCIFPEAGTYEVNLEAEGQVLARHRIMVA
jgi:hypothetical protein